MTTTTLTHSSLETSFEVDGDTCAATLHHAAHVVAGTTTPGVVLVHGFACDRSMRLEPYVSSLTAAGFAVLTYDPRGIGESDGSPRQLVEPDRLIADAHGAVTAMRRMDGIGRVGLAGFSFGGGVGIEVAADDRELFGLAHVAGFVGGRPRTEAEIAKILAAIHDDLATVGVPGAQPITIPVCGPPGSLAVLATADAEDGYRLLNVSGAAANVVPARSLLPTASFAPGPRVAGIDCPMLFVVCSNDLDVDPEATIAAAHANPDARVITYTGSHFDVYRPGMAEAWAQELADFMVSAHRTST